MAQGMGFSPDSEGLREHCEDCGKAGGMLSEEALIAKSCCTAEAGQGQFLLWRAPLTCYDGLTLGTWQVAKSLVMLGDVGLNYITLVVAGPVILDSRQVRGTSYGTR